MADYVNKYATPPGQTPPPDLPIGTRVMNAVDAAVLPPDRSATTLPATHDEAMVRRGVGAAATVATMGPGGLLAPAVAGVSAAVAPEIAKIRRRTGRNPGGNWPSTRSLQMSTGAAASRAGPTVDAADASTMQLARDKFQIPLNATRPSRRGQATARRHPCRLRSMACNETSSPKMGENPNTPDFGT